MQIRRRALVAALIAVLMVVAGCRARADVVVDVQPDGSGTVSVTGTFDPDAVTQIGDVAAAIKTDDLTAAGWKVTGPTTSGSDTVITVTKPFAAADRLGAVLQEIGGADGPFVGWKLTTSNSFTVSSYELTGRVKLTGSLDQFSDSEVAAALDGFAVGRSPDEIAALLADDPDALTLGIAVRLPGDYDEISGVAEKDPGAGSPNAMFWPASGTTVDQQIDVRSSSTDRSAVLWVLLGGGLIVAAVLLFVAGKQQARRRARRRPQPAS